MPKKEDIQHSVLIVSAAESFDALVRRSLKGFLMVDTRRNGASARRYILERYYDLVVINAPLPDETGEQLALDVAQQCSASVLLVAPADVFEEVLEHVTDFGILVLPKPMPRGRVDKAVRYLLALQSRIRPLEEKLRKEKEKAEELRIVNRAKFLLVEKKHMTEDEAHRLIGKMAMDRGFTRKRIAEELLDELEGE